MKNESELKQEYQIITEKTPYLKLDEFEQSCSYPSAFTELNYCRNRYQDVLPEESCRVKINTMKEDNSDYINASFISGHKQKYISCQAPLPHTISHFWCMVWEQQSAVICMLTRTIEGEKRKADVYWPDNEGECSVYGRVAITLKSMSKLPYITIRILTLKRLDTREERDIVHLHYTEWPDFGVPQTTHKIRELIQLLNYYKEKGASKGLTGPTIAHCSAGIGRGGTFIAILICLEKLTEGHPYEDLDLVEIVLQMRKSRCGMVQTEGQYIFIHQVLDDIVKEKQLKVTGKRNSGLHYSWDSFGVSSDDSFSNTDTNSDRETSDDDLSDNSSSSFAWYSVSERAVVCNP